MNTFPVIKKYLKNRVSTYYTDELRIFLVDALRQIDYLQGLSDEIIINIAFAMEVDYKESGALIINKAEPQDQSVDEMLIVYEGCLQAYTIVEESEEITFDYLGKGSVLRPNHFLAYRTSDFNIQVLDHTIYYYINTEKFMELCMKYLKLYKAVYKHIKLVKQQKFQGIKPLDYIRCDPETLMVKKMMDKQEYEQRMKVKNLKHILKNAVLFNLESLKQKKRFDIGSGQQVKSFQEVVKTALEKKRRDKIASQKLRIFNLDFHDDNEN